MGALLLCAACGSEGEANLGLERLPITEGDPVADDAYATVGMLLTRGNVSEGGAPAQNRIIGICTGTLISPTAVLTAEHCVNSMILTQSLAQDPRGLSLEGELQFQFTFARKIAEVMADSSAAIDVSKVDQSSDFAPLSNPLAAFAPAPAQWNDIAIAHLAVSVTGRPVQKLAPTEMVQALGMLDKPTLRAAGYGLTNDDDPMSAGVLTTGVSHLGEIGEFELVAGAGDRQQACRGDSGGPIFADETDGYQIGIASRVNKMLDLGDILNGGGKPPPCETGLVYTRVDAYKDWIAERVPDLGDSTSPGDGDAPGDGDTGDGDEPSDPGDGDDGNPPGDGDTGDGDAPGDGDGDGDANGEGDSSEGDAEGDDEGASSGGRGSDGGCNAGPVRPARGMIALMVLAAATGLARMRRRRH